MKVARYLMCPSSFFGVSYVINPWMENQIGLADHGLAEVQWRGLHDVFTQGIGVPVDLIEPVDGQPDMVFTANAGFVQDSIFVPARFRHAERQGEEPHFIKWFEDHGYERLEVEGFQEGAGDLLNWTSPEGDSTLVSAFGFRSDAETAHRFAGLLGLKTVSVELVDPRYYHLDTCFCPLPGGYLLWYPAAFSVASQEAIRNLVPSDLRHEAATVDAELFSCNAVGLTHQGQRHIVLGHVGPGTEAWLVQQGFKVHVTPLSEFLKAGGSAKCLTLRLDSGLV